MKKIILFLVMTIFLGGAVFAATGFESDIKIKNEEEITGLSDKTLLDTYVNVVVEIEVERFVLRERRHEARQVA